MRALRFFATSGAEGAPASAAVVYVPSSDASWAFADADVARGFARSVGAHGIGRLKGSRRAERAAQRIHQSSPQAQVG